MAVKIRLRRQGRTNRPFYRLVVTDSRAPRGGKYLETLGWYNPVEEAEERHMLIKADRLQHWLSTGAELSEKAESLAARGAPEVVKEWKDRIMARQAKLRDKAKARRRAAAK